MNVRLTYIKIRRAIVVLDGCNINNWLLIMVILLKTFKN